MAKVIFTVTTKDVFTDEGLAKELIDVNAVIEGVNHESPSAADHLANIINKMAPQIIKAAQFHYINEWNARSEIKKSSH